MELKTIIPMGRSFADYRDMFCLDEDGLTKMRILGCGDGPASFNMEATRLGASVHSVDPLYAFSALEIKARIDETFEDNFRQIVADKGKFVFTRYPDIEAHKQARKDAMDAFLSDYEGGRIQGRYREASLPSLPFPDDAFDLALVSHLLFLYSAHLTLEFHIASIRELMRLARETRIFPLVDLNAKPSPYVEAVKDTLRGDGYVCDEIEVDYEVQKGATRMLRIARI